MLLRFAVLGFSAVALACLPQIDEATRIPAPSRPLETPAALSSPVPPSDCSPAPLSTVEPERLIAPTELVEPPGRFQPTIFRQDRLLQEALLAALGSEAGSYAFLVKDLRTGRGAAHNADKVFYAASLFKLFVMFEVFHQESRGLLSLSDPVTITPYYETFGLGPRLTTLCQTLPVGEALRAMIGVSDNAAAVRLQDLVGAPNVNRSLEAMGLRKSGLFPEGLPLTAADTALLLEAIGRGRAVSQEASQRMLALLGSEQFDNGLRAGLPASARLAHKTGNWQGSVHDAGIVFWERGAYLIVVLSEGERAGSVIPELSRRAYTHFAGSVQP